MPFHVKSLLILLSLLLIVSAADARDTLDSVLANAAAKQHVAIEYREVRHLQLLNEPWQAEGEMLVSGHTFAIEQQRPERQLITANRSRFWLFIPAKNIRRTGMLTTPMAKKSLGLFKPVMRGDRAALERDFNIQFSATDVEWQLELQPKQSADAVFKRITVKGTSGEAAKQMITELPDGDFTEWFFQQQKTDAASKEKLKRLMDEARGD